MNHKPIDRESAYQRLARNLIEPLVPSDAKERVERAVLEYRQAIRGAIRSETRLSLGDDDARDSDPIRVVEGFPERLAQVIHRRPDQRLWRLLLALPKLGGIVEGLELLLCDWPGYESWPHLPEIARGAGPSLQRARDVADALQKVGLLKSVVADIRDIDEDILGAYFYGTTASTRIEIYWMSHALVAGLIGVRIEDLVFVVLAHELAHAYTHLGRDIDGGRWETKSFAGTETCVKEGLAQYYAREVARKHSSRVPLAEAAMKELLELQAPPYHEHLEWDRIAGRPLREVVRFTLLKTRRQGAISKKIWREELGNTASSLPSGPPKRGLF